jgi:hypothetical protein
MECGSQRFEGWWECVCGGLPGGPSPHLRVGYPALPSRQERGILSGDRVMEAAACEAGAGRKEPPLNLIVFDLALNFISLSSAGD